VGPNDVMTIHHVTTKDKTRLGSQIAIIEKTMTWLRIVKEATGRTPLLYTASAW